MKRTINMRELRKLTAGAIQELRYPVPIKSGAVTVGVLLPVHSGSKERLREVLASYRTFQHDHRKPHSD